MQDAKFDAAAVCMKDGRNCRINGQGCQMNALETSFFGNSLKIFCLANLVCLIGFLNVSGTNLKNRKQRMKCRKLEKSN